MSEQQPGSREALESALAVVPMSQEDEIERMGNEALRLSEASDGVLLSWVSPAPIAHFLELLPPLSPEITEIVAIAFDKDGRDVVDEWVTSLHHLAASDGKVMAVRVSLRDGSVIVWQAAGEYSDTAVVADTQARCQEILSQFLDASAKEALAQRLAG